MPRKPRTCIICNTRKCAKPGDELCQQCFGRKPTQKDISMLLNLARLGVLNR